MIGIRSPCLLTLLSLGSLAVAGRRPRFEPLPECSECVTRANILAPGVGIDLTASYGTATIRYYNGSVVNLGRVDASQEYIELMSRLSNSSKTSCHSATWDEIRCFLDRTKRRLNKMHGLPATDNVGIISNLIHELRGLVDGRLGEDSVKSALPTVHSLPGLAWEDLRDALEYAGFAMLSTHKHISSIVSETSAAFAGMGYGLCERYDNCDHCEDEGADMPFSHILSLSFSQTSFSAAYTYTQSAFLSGHEKEAVHFDLGLAKLPESQDEKGIYWNAIQKSIVDVGRVSRWPLTHLLLLGEDANHADFIETVKAALRELVPENPRDINLLLLNRPPDTAATLDPLYVAARGAAEFAKRSLASPASCRKPPRCAEDRPPPDIGNKDQGDFKVEL